MYKVDADGKQMVKPTPKTFAELRLLERFDIQEWIAKSPEILGEDLLIISKEHVRREKRDQATRRKTTDNNQEFILVGERQF